MNVAFPALLIFVLVLPGIILRYTYTRGFWRWLSPTSVGSLPDEIAYSVTFAIGLHLLWGPITAWFASLEIDPHSILVLLIGSYGHDDKFFEPAVTSVSEHPFAVVFYLLSLYLMAAGLGYGAHFLVRKYKLDRKTHILRFRNEWYYLLTGEVLEFKEVQGTASSGDASNVHVYLSAVVDLSAASYLYRGVVTGFWFDRSGNLDKIQLILAHRRLLSDDKNASSDDSDRYYDIEGNYFILRYAETKTINLYYFTLER